MSLRYDMTAATHRGKVRARNEDCVRILPDLGLAVVADGMGGHNAGDVASRMAVDALCDFLQERWPDRPPSGHLIGDTIGDALAEAFAAANRAVFTASRQWADCAGMGTTLLAAAFAESGAHVGHIGDCRLYRFAAGALEPLTTDHTLAAALLAEEPGAAVPEYSHHVLRKALGLESVCQPDFFTFAPAAGECYLLCSDGLCGVLDDAEIAATLSHKSGDPEAGVDALVAASLAHGGPDNISAILVTARG